MLSPLISLADLNIHMSKTPFCHLKNGGPASFCYKVFTEGLVNFTDMFALHDPTSTCMWSDTFDIMFFLGGVLIWQSTFPHRHSVCISIWFVLQTLSVMKQIESCCLTTGVHFGRSCPQNPDRERATMVSFKQQTGPRPSRERGRVWGREVLNHCAIQRPSINHVNRFGGGTESTPARLM